MPNGKLTVTEKDGLVDWSDIVITIDDQSLTVEQLATAWKKAHDELTRAKKALGMALGALERVTAGNVNPRTGGRLILEKDLLNAEEVAAAIKKELGQMRDRIEGVPEGYRLKRIGRATNGEYFITHGCGVMKWTESMETVDVYPILELIPIEPEQPKQLEAVIVVPMEPYGWDGVEMAISTPNGLSIDEGYRLKRMYPDRVTIREKALPEAAQASAEETE